jgi:hypothetical protein
MNWRMSLPSAALAGALLCTLTPIMPQAQAGDKEWAVAGKILTGIVVIDAVRGLAQYEGRKAAQENRGPQTRYYREQPQQYYVPPPPRPQPAVVYLEQPTDYITPRSHLSYSKPSTIEIHNHYYTAEAVQAAQAGQQEQTAPPPAPVAAPVVQPAPQAAPAPAPVQHTEQMVINSGEGDTVVLVIEEGRRIWQPKTRGAKAYMQVWSDLEKKWVSIKEYPSIY